MSKFISAKDRLAESARSFDDNAKQLQSETPTADCLAMATRYWIGYPSFFEDITAMPGATSDEKYMALHSLNAAHLFAVRFLMREAKEHGLDGAGLWEAGRVCRELYDTRPPGILVRLGATQGGNWPDTLGEARYKLPQAQQDAIRDGDAVFMALANAMNFPTTANVGRIIAVPPDLLQKARNWLYARFVEYQKEHNLVRRYSCDGSPEREPTEDEKIFAPVPLREFHEFLLSVGGDIQAIISNCEHLGWIRYAEGGFDVRNMQRFYHILPAITIPWQETPSANGATQTVPMGTDDAPKGKRERKLETDPVADNNMLVSELPSSVFRLLELLAARPNVRYKDIPAELRNALRIARNRRLVERESHPFGDAAEEHGAYCESLNFAYWLSTRGKDVLAEYQEFQSDNALTPEEGKRDGRGRRPRTDAQKVRQKEIADRWRNFYESKVWVEPRKLGEGNATEQFCQSEGIDQETLATALRQNRRKKTQARTAKKKARQ